MSVARTTARAAAPGVWVAVALVAAGTVVGAAVRAGLGPIFGQPHTVGGLSTILAVNLAGALILGIITELCVGGRRWQPLVKLAAGTGFCGGFTTYSTFAVDVALVQSHGPGQVVLLYLAATLFFGPPAALCGISLGAWLRPKLLGEALRGGRAGSTGGGHAGSAGRPETEGKDV